MGYINRKKIIKDIQSIRKSKIITHMNSDRRAIGPILIPGLVTQLSTEAQPHFISILNEFGNQSKIELFLYTNGGNTNSVWPLVSLIREHTDNFNVIVPYKAHSAGTLICLGANKILICKAGELSPIDPSTGNPFNPVDEINSLQRKVISVEDVSAYFDLARNPLKKNDEPERDKISDSLAFQILTANVHPLALGMVNRSHKQIRDLAQRLLSTHDSLSEEQLVSVINTFTEERYSHTDIFNRKEVKDLLGNNIVEYPNGEEERLFHSLYIDYINSIDMLAPFCPSDELGDSQSKELSVTGGFIESEDFSYIFNSTFVLTRRSDLPKNFQVQLSPKQPLPLIDGLPEIYHINLLKMGWQLNSESI